MFSVFVAYPFLQGFPISFTKWDGMSPDKTFVGMSNYLRIFKDANVINATKNTLVTFPMIAPAVTTNFTLLLAWGMKVFDYPMAATAGGPGRASETVAMLIYNNLFTYFRAGYGQAIAVVFTIAIFAVSTIVSRTLRAREVEI